MNSEEIQSEFSYVLRSNELAKNIADTSFLIKLNAINALLLALRVDDEMKGYIVVTDEFIKFSKGMIDLADSLRDKIFKQVAAISNQMKNENKARLLNKAISTSSKSMFLESVSNFVENNLRQMRQFVMIMAENSESVLNELKQSEKFVMRGDILAMQAKIEGAYAGSSRDIFNSVAESLQESLNQIKRTISEMEKLLQHTHHEYESKSNMIEGES